MAHTLADELPPHYTDFSTELPLTFRVGSEHVSPLVNVTEIQAHLRLLRAFKKLQEDVHNAHAPALGKGGIDGLPSDKDRAWVVFVNRAVYRFDKFMSGKWRDWPAWSEECIVPLDVIMVWHTFLLNPRAYHEDSIRRTTPFARRLIEMESMPLTLIASLIDPTTFEPLLPSARREAFFENISGLPYMYSLTTTTSDAVSLPCPCCDTINPTVKWITPEGNVGGNGTGFAEPSFVHQCAWCEKKFTRATMGVRKFTEEFTRKRAGRKVYFPETLLQPMSGKPDPMIGDMIIVRLLRRLNSVFKLNGPVKAEDIADEAISLGERLFWSADELAVHLHTGLQPQKKYDVNDGPLPRLQRMMAAYSIPGYASIDLVAAVLRQGSFIDKMDGLGWLEESRFQSVHHQALLRRAIARYHAFLDLMSANASTFYVPTLDIDLVWHTHQLSAAAYRSETLRLLERTPNHDDTIQPITIQSAYDSTASAWKARFGVPYSVCGCMPDPPPKAKSSNPFRTSTPLKSSKSPGSKSKFSLFRRTMSSKSASPAYTAEGEPREDLVTNDLMWADASHPSDHNLYLEKPDVSKVQSDLISRELASKERMQAIKKDLDRVESKATTGSGSASEGSSEMAVDKWRKLQAERKASRPEHGEAFTRKEGVNGVYYPYWGVSAYVPNGFFGAVKYEDAVGGCGSGCASCGYSPGAFGLSIVPTAGLR